MFSLSEISSNSQRSPRTAAERSRWAPSVRMIWCFPETRSSFCENCSRLASGEISPFGFPEFCFYVTCSKGGWKEIPGYSFLQELVDFPAPPRRCVTANFLILAWLLLAKEKTVAKRMPNANTASTTLVLLFFLFFLWYSTAKDLQHKQCFLLADGLAILLHTTLSRIFTKNE